MPAKINFSLPVTIFKEGKYFIAFTPALDLATQGKNFEDAKKAFSEAVEIFFEKTTKMGTLGTVLQNLGWQINKKSFNSSLLQLPSQE